jgi:amidase
MLMIKKPAHELIRLLKEREITSEELTRLFLARIREVNPVLNAVVQMNEEETLATARKADLAIAQGKKLGRLHGLPLTIKDTIDIKGFKNTYGSYLFQDYQPKVEGTCVTRLREAGAVILGLTNVPELLTAFETDNLIYGKTTNPHDGTRTCGGSSGGEAAIISAFGSPLGLGNDGAGSIRIPAHFCGVTGFKPTQGLIPTTGVSSPEAGAGCLQPYGTCGPIARSAEDLYLALSVLSGPDKCDPNVPPVTLGDFANVDIGQLKVAYFTDNGIVSASKDIEQAVLDAAAILAEHGAKVEEVRPKNIEKSFKYHWETFFTLADGGETVQSFVQSLPEEKISFLRKIFHHNATKDNLTNVELNQRFLEISEFKHGMYQFLNQYDLLICPPCATTAKLHGESINSFKDFSYTMAFNISGSPAVVVPFAVSKDGLPIGVQIVANLWKDHVALAAAKIIEKYYPNLSDEQKAHY